jgi:hypothetical protein
LFIQIKPSAASRLRCRLKRLEVTGCDWVGDTSIKVLSQTCAASITHLDVKGLDELTNEAGFYLAQCRKLTHVDMRSTGVSDEACRLLATRLPLGQQNVAERRIEPRPESCAFFNEHVMERRYLHAASVRIQMEVRRWLATIATRKIYAEQFWASSHCQRLARSVSGCFCERLSCSSTHMTVVL